MKKICFSLFLLFVPFLSMAADDHCTKQNEYTIDRRCYVRWPKKQTEPYNSVVALVKNRRNYCTGTIVREKDNNPYLYTAKHCVLDKDGNLKNTVEIKLWNNEILTATKNNVGNLDRESYKNLDGDWAIYSINPSGYVLSMVEKSKFFFGDQNAIVVGYGALAIMSDKQISDFKNKYINYLSSLKVAKKNYIKYGISYNGVHTKNEHVINFLEKNPGLLNTSDVGQLKESKCWYSGKGKQTRCQAWGGNSGGPIFDESGRIMGILTMGNNVIGGATHASSTVSVPLF
jgi:V8-like Glu-specific endopeptidase